MEIYAAPQSKLTALKASNPAYWSLRVSRSEYSESEIDLALAAVEEVNAKLHSFLSTAYDLLVWEDGKEMNYIPNGFASEKHQELNGLLSDLGGSYVIPSFSQNSHLNGFPVAKWLKEINGLNKKIARIEKFVQKF